MSRVNVATGAGIPPRVAADQDLKVARTLVNALDRYGLDPIIGLLLPGLGDIITMVLGTYLIGVAHRRGVKPIVIARMLLNLGVDAAVGIIPIVGDVADFGIQANKKNLALLEARSERKATWRDWFAVGGSALLVIGMFSLAIYGLVRLFGAIF